MPVAPQDRPLASLREETIDQLVVNYGHGKLSREALERRLDQAMEATTHDALLALTADLELKADKAYAQQKNEEFKPRPAAPSTGVEHMINVFGGSNRRGAWTVPSDIKMINVFGGADLDFSQASFTAPVTHVSLFCLFGGASFYVNENINFVSKAVCIFGGVDNHAASTPGAPTIVLEGLVLFGGASIKIKKSLRDRWVEFAEHFKAAFGEVHHRY